MESHNNALEETRGKRRGERDRARTRMYRERRKRERALQQPIDVCPTNTLKDSRESHQNALQKGIGEMREREIEKTGVRDNDNE